MADKVAKIRESAPETPTSAPTGDDPAAELAKAREAAQRAVNALRSVSATLVDLAAKINQAVG